MTQPPEARIKEAARKLFLAKGYRHTTIREIAEEAEINLAMLNYYYRSKDRLFQQIIEEEMNSFAPPLCDILEAPIPLPEKIGQFVDTYTGLMLQTPTLALFVISEMRADPRRFLMLSGFRNMYNSRPFFEQIREYSQGRVDPRQLYTHLVSLLVSPFLMHDVIRFVYELHEEKDFQQFVEDRKPAIVQAVLGMLENNTPESEY